ncbi:MAG TPA: FMN-binding protein [Holophagaceae bacterium]|nr:FMN-binding protein [Holophagaceae bacterium]
MIRILAPAFMTAALLAGGLPTQQEALALAFPGAQFQRKEFFLTEAQAAAVKQKAGVDLPGLWIVAYEARKDGQLLGVGLFDTHRVRTLNETALVAVTPEGRVKRVEIVAFREPQDYMAKEAWIRQFEGRKLDQDLMLQRGIKPLSGATLTANALTDASRRCLALWQVLYGGAK